MRKLILTFFVFLFSCMKDTFILSPLSINHAKERNAFIKEFVTNDSIVFFNGNEYLFEEVYLTYMVDSKKVHKNALRLVFKTKNTKSQKFECPDDYSKFEIVIDTIKYELGSNAFNLYCRIPINTSYFTLNYNDNNVTRIVHFYEKMEN